MSIAENLRRDADAALREDGMYYSGKYLDGIAKKVEEVESENKKLRKLVRKWYPHALRRVGREALEQWGQMDVVREVGSRGGLMDDYMTANIRISDLERCNADLDALESENTKLKELVKNMHGWLVVNHEKSYVIPLNGLNDIERDMRELGIEVDA